MKHAKNTVAALTALLIAGAAGMICAPLTFYSAHGAQNPPEPPAEIHLTGVIRDFKAAHSDFGVSGTGMGHYVQNVSQTLAGNGLPTYVGGGLKVTSQWRDKNNNPIMPYGGTDPGLPGGHFDVDVYNAATKKVVYHKHEFDDAYDVTYIDIANDLKLKFKQIIPDSYPNALNLVFFNTNNGGGGTYTFQAGGALVSGSTADGFTTSFMPSALTKLRVDFVSLASLCGTTPGTSQADIPNRAGAFAVRMYDSVTNVLKYEIAVYHHINNNSPPPTSYPPPAPPANDNCNQPINDTKGTYGSPGTGMVTNSSSFNQWFTDHLGTNLSQQHTITLKRNMDGDYEYMTDEFFPIDNQLMGNEGASHNNFFTFTIQTTFTYHACTGQFFEFQGNDDAWLFINGQLVMDLGGAATPSRQYVALDRLGLVDGQPFTLDFFYAHRRDAGDNLFHMKTNLWLASAISDTLTAGFD